MEIEMVLLNRFLNLVLWLESLWDWANHCFFMHFEKWTIFGESLFGWLFRWGKTSISVNTFNSAELCGRKYRDKPIKSSYRGCDRKMWCLGTEKGMLLQGNFGGFVFLKCPWINTTGIQSVYFAVWIHVVEDVLVTQWFWNHAEESVLVLIALVIDVYCETVCSPRFGGLFNWLLTASIHGSPYDSVLPRRSPPRQNILHGKSLQQRVYRRVLRTTSEGMRGMWMWRTRVLWQVLWRRLLLRGRLSLWWWLPMPWAVLSRRLLLPKEQETKWWQEGMSDSPSVQRHPQHSLTRGSWACREGCQVPRM